VSWDSSDETIVAVFTDSTDHTKAVVRPGGTLGQAQISAMADVDLGEGVKELATTMDVNVVADRTSLRRRTYSITSSASASSIDGIFRPSALAVLRLMAYSDLVDWTDGSSAGFSPLRRRRQSARPGSQLACRKLDLFLR
jgi:hypothetical protein